MSLKLTKIFQVKLENILESQEYKIRFEKGNFKSGYCIIKDKKVVVINKYFSLEGKINALIEIIKSIITELGSNEFSRIRLGISQDRNENTINYVLGKFRPQEQIIIDQVINSIPSVIYSILSNGFITIL